MFVEWFVTNKSKKSHESEFKSNLDVGHYGKSLYLKNSESSNCICVFH